MIRLEPRRCVPSDAVEPVVSVLVLAYNHEPYLEQCLESVLSQEIGFHVEVLIGEDGSSDGTLSIARKFEREHPGVISVLSSPVNLGLYENYRRVLESARGRFIAYLEGDDYWLPGKLSKQVAFLQRVEDCAAVYSNAVVVDRNGKALGFFNDVRGGAFDLADLLRHGNFLHTGSMLFRAEIIPSLLKIDRTFIDYRMHLVNSLSGRLEQLDEPLAAYRVNSVSSMLANKRDDVRRMYWEAIAAVPADAVEASAIGRAHADFLRRVIFRAVRTRDLALLRYWFWPTLRSSPAGISLTGWYIGAAIMRATVVQTKGWLASRWFGAPFILYRR